MTLVYYDGKGQRVDCPTIGGVWLIRGNHKTKLKLKNADDCYAYSIKEDEVIMDEYSGPQ